MPGFQAHLIASHLKFAIVGSSHSGIMPMASLTQYAPVPGPSGLGTAFLGNSFTTNNPSVNPHTSPNIGNFDDKHEIKEH